MSCEICGKNNCTKSFHSIEEQDNYDNAVDGIKDRILDRVISKVNEIIGRRDEDDEYVVSIEKVFEAIESLR